MLQHSCKTPVKIQQSSGMHQICQDICFNISYCVIVSYAFIVTASANQKFRDLECKVLWLHASSQLSVKQCFISQPDDSCLRITDSAGACTSPVVISLISNANLVICIACKFLFWQCHYGDMYCMHNLYFAISLWWYILQTNFLTL